MEKEVALFFYHFPSVKVSGSQIRRIVATGSVHRLNDSLLASEKTTQTGDDMERKIEYALEYMKENMTRKISVNDLSRAAGVCQSRLYQLFRFHLDDSPTQVLKRLRLKRATQLLSTTNLNVQEIRCQIGYGDDSHFARDFKKMYGMTPLQYRCRCHHQ